MKKNISNQHLPERLTWKEKKGEKNKLQGLLLRGRCFFQFTEWQVNCLSFITSILGSELVRLRKKHVFKGLFHCFRSRWKLPDNSRIKPSKNIFFKMQNKHLISRHKWCLFVYFSANTKEGGLINANSNPIFFSLWASHNSNYPHNK